MKKNVLVAGLLGVFAAIVYFCSLAHYAFPGTSAHLMAVWRGLDVVSTPIHPLMAVFAKALGGGNLLAPVCGIAAVLLVFFLVRTFVRTHMTSEAALPQAGVVSTIAAAAASFVFMLTPAVRSAATHLEPSLFEATWALAIFALLVPYDRAGKATWFYPILLGALTALGFCDSVLFLVFAPVVFAGIVIIELRRSRKPFLALTLFAVALLLVFFVALNGFGLELTPFLKRTAKDFKAYFDVKGWIFVLMFSTLPFVTSIFSCPKAFNEKPGLVMWTFHIVLSIVAILAVATPLSPSSLLAPTGGMPVVTSAYAAIVSGYLVAFWWFYRKRPVGIVSGVVLAFVLLFASFWNLFAFRADRGAFADAVAGRILDDLGSRTWFVTDGVLDDHLLLVAAERGQELNLITLSRDLEVDYLQALSKRVRAKKIAGSKNDALTLSLSLGVLPFVQDWFASDPTVAKDVAIFGAPDLWYSAGITPVPENLFFGADAGKAPATDAWASLEPLLTAPKGWGSYRLHEERDPVERLRLNLRRHIGFVTNNRGVYLQDQKQNDAAFACYDLVLNAIDTDNVCALFNEIEMAGQKYAKAQAKQRELERRIKSIVDDKDRRYVIWRLGTYYGYIRNPDMFVRLGFAWARSGRPGDALAHIRRAIDFVPTDKRATLLNMMAALYANDNDHRKSRQIYEAVLAKNERDHDALVGMMRLELLEGDSKKALEYLERAIAASSGEGKHAQIELSMVALMKNDYKTAESRLAKVTEGEPKDMQAWSLLAAVKMQQYDAAKDDKARAAILKDITGRILPAMEKNTDNPFDYYIQITKAFVLLKQGVDKRREARDAFVVASKVRPDTGATSDLILGLDITLDDKVNAEQHARETLRRNRNAPLANYVMGSLMLQKGKFQEAEAFLRRAVNTAHPTVLALNDLAEVLRRQKVLDEAERHVLRATELAPEFYILWETLGAIQLDRGDDIAKAEENVRKAIRLSKQQGGEEDLRLYATLARVQLAKGDTQGARNSVRKVHPKVRELTDYERKEYEGIRERVR